MRSFLTKREIASAIYYPVPLHRQECFQSLGPQPPLPVSESLAGEVLSLPVFPEMTGEEQQAVIAAIGEFCSAPAGT